MLNAAGCEDLYEMTDVSLAGAFYRRIDLFPLSLRPPARSRLHLHAFRNRREQLRQGEQPKGGLFSFRALFRRRLFRVFIGFGASASAVGGFLQQHKNLLTPIAGALILLFGLHLLAASSR